jgi:arginase
MTPREIDHDSANHSAVFTRPFGNSGRESLDQIDLPYWIHFEVDVLDKRIMPAVDKPGSPRIDPDDLAFLLRGLLNTPDCLGLDV